MRGLGLGLSGGMGSVAAGGGFSDDFAGSGPLSGSWLVEMGADTVFERVSGALRGQGSVSGDNARAFYTGRQIPAGWAQITVSGNFRYSTWAGPSGCLGVCFDAVPTGHLNTSGGGTPVQNAYFGRLSGGGNEDPVVRRAAGALTLFGDTELFEPDSTLREYKLVITKLADRVRFQRYWDGAPVGSAVDDTTGSRHTGACYVCVSGTGSYIESKWAEWGNVSCVWT